MTRQENPRLSADCLYAFYDLEVSPASFDICSFAVLAELERRERDLAAIAIVIVPGPNEGYRNDDAPYSTLNKDWRLQNILLPVCGLLDSRVSIFVCNSREEARQIEGKLARHTFPAGYRTDAPRGEFLWSGITSASARGMDIPKFKASDQALEYIETWLQRAAGNRKVVAITLRETSYSVARNSNVAEWLKFAGSLDPKEYQPVFIRDTEALFTESEEAFEDFPCFPAASLNVDVRMAIYQRAWLNMMVPNGPNSLCWHGNGIRSLTFKMVTESADASTPLMLASIGIEPGGQSNYLGPLQKFIWEEDDFEVLRREFEQMATYLNTIGDADNSDDLTEEREDVFETGVRLQMTGRIEDATSIYQHIVSKDPGHSDAWHMLAIIAQQAEKPETAEKLVGKAISVAGDRANYYVTYGHILQNLGRLSEAELAFRRALAIAPKDAGAFADLAMILATQGKQHEAENAMMSALQIDPGNVEFYEMAGQLLEDGGNPNEAVKFYRRAIDVRQETIARIREARSHMSEIPQLTLKT